MSEIKTCDKCKVPMKDMGSWYSCRECGEKKENIAGVFLYASGYGLTPAQLHQRYKAAKIKP